MSLCVLLIIEMISAVTYCLYIIPLLKDAICRILSLINNDQFKSETQVQFNCRKQKDLCQVY